MRPIVLDLNGFASFREPAHVDFTDADFFALVGPTGAGKSTVIDAMTFALYGSVPRWGRKGMVSLALAPTVTRGTVRLVFEVGGQRFVVARELRRMGSQVNQRAASLERLADPAGLAAPGEGTEVLARDLAAVTEAVERLLGLSYDDFCQCVVLPQGQFANFLHAKPSERQEILLRLLGAEHYRQMMMRANQRASNAAQRADALTDTLTTFADATGEAQDAARAAEETLAALKERTAAAVPQIRQAQERLASAQALLARLRQEQQALSSVQVPADIATLDTALRAARSAAELARTAERLAEDADSASRAALAAGPQRAPLERARDQRADLARLTTRLPGARSDVARLGAEAAEARAGEDQAVAALADLRGRRDAASRQDEDATRHALDLAGEHAALAEVAVPGGTEQLDRRCRLASQAQREAQAALQAAEQADTEARAARGSAIAAGPLEQALRDLADLGGLDAGLAGARKELGQARAAAAISDSALRAAEAASQQRQRELDDIRRANVAADLRPHLEPGHACPVCEQIVTAVPAALDAPALGQAQAMLDEALGVVAAQRRKAADDARVQDTAAVELTSLERQRARVVAALTTLRSGPLADAPLAGLAAVLSHEAASPEPPADDGQQAKRVGQAVTEVEALLTERRNLDQAADDAAAAVESARAHARSAQEKVTQAEADLAAARQALSAARDPLVRLGAPPADDASLTQAWAGLASWAAAQAAARADELAASQAAAKAAAAELASIQAELAMAERAVTESRAKADAAAGAEQKAGAVLAELTDRIEELGELLRSAPEEAQVNEQLALLGALEQAAADAGQGLLAARSERTKVERALADQERAESEARSRLSAARDPLVPLGAPAIDPGQAGLIASWQELASWARAEVAAREQAGDVADQEVSSCRSAVAELAGRLSADLASAGVDIDPGAEPGSVASQASQAVAVAIERARAETARISERRAQAADLIARRDADRDEQAVARLLGDLLRSDRFPRWLVTAAIDVLVAEASVILADLSSGQYSLTHEAGDFYIVDHADADSHRSVRTLSGGETFQASLALALALSAQLTTLAAAGAARLDSIFLDEGFGTLDPDTLEVVATTLESLAQGQRMVGIVTHVAALAERVPVRFVVSRDARSSTVVRDGLPAPEAA